MNDDLMTTLRGMDPADPAASPRSDRAQRDLTTILATRPEPSASTDPAPASGTARTTRPAPRRGRYVLAAAAAVCAVGIAFPLVAPRPAYAGWVVEPTQASVPVAKDAEESCREMWVDSGIDAADMADPGFAEPTAMRAALTERRGPWTFTVMRGPEGQLADCLINRSRFSLLAGGSSGGSMSGLPPSADPDGNEVDVAVLAAMSGSSTMGPFAREHQAMAYVYGRAGEDVRSVVVHTAAQGEVVASVQNGIWSAWWPTEDHLSPEGLTATATVTVADGTSREVDLDELAIAWAEEDG